MSKNYDQLCIDIFPSNIKRLRYAHRLSLNNLAVLLNFKTKTSVTLLESGKAEASADTLIRLSNLFAVNIDWLFGRSNEIYSNNIILALENEFTTIPFHNTLDPQKPFLTFLESTPKSYQNIDKRQKYYSLAERANILFLLQYYLSLTSRFPELLDGRYAHIEQPSILERFKQKLLKTTSTPRYKSPDEEWDYILRALWSILGNQYREDAFGENNEFPFLLNKEKIFAPLFDINKTTVD